MARRMKMLLVLALIVLAACEAPAPYEGPEPVPGRRAAVFGDSITRSAIPAGRITNAKLKHPFAISWNAHDGWRTDQHLPEIEWVGIATPDIVIVATGTNDARDAVDATDDAVIDEVLVTLERVPCVIWVNIRSEIPGREAWNPLLASKVYGPGRRIGDWDTYSDDHPEWIDADGVHLSEHGKGVYARWLSREMIVGC